MGPRDDLDERKISPSPGFDPGPSSPYSVAIPTELPGPQLVQVYYSDNCTERNSMYSLGNISGKETGKDVRLVSSILIRDRGSTVVKVLCYKSEGRWFDHWNFSLT